MKIETIKKLTLSPYFTDEMKFSLLEHEACRDNLEGVKCILKNTPLFLTYVTATKIYLKMPVKSYLILKEIFKYII
jgi:hypothetical protein